MPAEPRGLAAPAKDLRGVIHVPRRFALDEWGGTETVILEISRQQQLAGFKPRILSSLALSRELHEEVAGVPVKRFPYCYPFLGLSKEAVSIMDHKGGNLLSLSLLKALITEPRVRIYHAHAINRVGGMVRLAARLRRKPFVVSVHGGVFDVPEAERSALLKPIEGKIEWGKIFGTLCGSRRVLQDADMVVFVGDSEAQKARDLLGHKRFAYLPNGVDCARFSRGNGPAFRAKHGIPQDSFLLMNISRIDAQKNQMLLLEAFEKFAQSEPLAYLVIMGPVTQPGYAKKLQDFIKENGLTKKVQLLPGLQSHDPDLVNAYHACDVFVLPSMHEPFGIVVLEAWSAGKPVIASRIGGLKKLVRDGHTGLCIEPEGERAVHNLEHKIAMLHANAPWRETLGEAGRQEAVLRYDWSIISQKLEGIYQKAEQNMAERGRKQAV